MKIFENRIRKIVSETLHRFILSESFTNMKQLYHKLTLNALVNLVRVNSLFLSPSNHSGRGGKYYASLSRYKNSIEGFNPVNHVYETEEYYTNTYATITFNIPKLTRVHGISIRPFDFYGTHADERNDYDAKNTDSENNGIYSKVAYQKLKKRFGSDDDEDYDDDYDYNYDDYDNDYDDDSYDDEEELEDYDSPEYYNMAEEQIVSDTLKEIPNIYNYIDRIDVYFPTTLLKPPSDGDSWDFGYDDEAYYVNSYSYAHALCRVACGTEWENKIAVNLLGYDNKVKTISLTAFSNWLKRNKDYANNEKRANKIVNKAPKNRKNFEQVDYYDDEDYDE